MKLNKDCDPYILVKYFHEKNITELKGRKWTKRLTRNPKSLLDL